jgi:hypothetical protein
MPPPDIRWLKERTVQRLAYVPISKAVKADPTLSYIAADEPIVPAGFPPLPNNAELAGGASSWTGSGTRGDSGGPGGVDTVNKKQSHGGYNHAKAGEFAPQGQTRHYRTSNREDHATGSGGTNTINQNTVLGKEPSLNPHLDQGMTPGAPDPVVIKQSTTQDLSLPDDSFSGSNQKKKNAGGHGMVKQLTQQNLTRMRNMGPSMINSAIHF